MTVPALRFLCGLVGPNHVRRKRLSQCLLFLPSQGERKAKSNATSKLAGAIIVSLVIILLLRSITL